jgi:hypothetical protein
LLGAALSLPAAVSIGACSQMSGKPRYTLSPRGDRLVRWLQNEGKDTMLAPDALALMGITNEDRWIPARQFGEDGPDGRYVVSLVNIRNIHEFVFHRRHGDVLILHNSDTAFKRLTSVRWARNGKPVVITDTAFADSDFQQQIAFWFSRIPGR